MADDESAPTPPPPAPPQSWPTAPQPTVPPYGTPSYGSQPTTPLPTGAQPTTPLPTTPGWAQPAGGATPAWGTPPPAPGPVAEEVAWGAPPPRAGSNVGLVLAVAASVVVVGLLAVLAFLQPWRSGDDEAGAAPAPTASTLAPLPLDPGPSGVLPTPGDGRTAPAVPTSPALPRVSLGPEQQAYVDAANAFCRKNTDPDLKKAVPLLDSNPQAFFRAVAKANRELDVFLRKDVPGDIADRVQAIADAWDDMALNYARAADAVDSGDLQGAAGYLQTGDASNERGNALARSLGMDDCAGAGGLGTDNGTGGSTGTPVPGVTA